MTESKGAILLVDNEPENLAVLNTHLHDNGYEILIAENGEAALKRIVHVVPDIILLDIRMPGMDGFETCRRLKANAASKDIPVLFMTVVADTSEKVKGFDVGAVDFITKPFQIGEVLARVETHLTLQRLRNELKEKNAALQKEITEHKRTEQALRDSEALLNETGAMAHVGGWRLDVDTYQLNWTEEVYRIHEVGPDYEPTVDNAVGFYAPEARPIIARAVRRAIDHEEPFDLELPLISAKGRQRWVHAIGKANREHGGTLRVSGIFQDITERKRAEEALRQSEAKYRRLFEDAAIGVFHSTFEGRFIDVNPALARMLGYDSPGEVIDSVHNIADQIYAEPLKRTAIIADTLAKGESIVAENRYRRKDGSVWTGNLILRHVMDEQCQAQYLEGFVEDITERKLAEAKLREYSEHLEEMVNERTAELRKAQEELLVKERLAVLGHFAGSISHELRNPLAVIDSSVYFLTMKFGTSDEKISQHLGFISSNVKKSVAIIESLLNLSRMEKPKTEKTNLTDVVSETLAGVKIPDTVCVVLNFPEKEMWVDIDPEQIRMALKNIIKNAFQAMDDVGKLTIISGRSKPGKVELCVADTGPGIAPEHLEKVFEPLFSTKTHGIGFGLSIVKMIVENHGGTVRAESILGKGATFAIILPKIEEKEIRNA